MKLITLNHAEGAYLEVRPLTFSDFKIGEWSYFVPKAGDTYRRISATCYFQLDRSLWEELMAIDEKLAKVFATESWPRGYEQFTMSVSHYCEYDLRGCNTLEAKKARIQQLADETHDWVQKNGQTEIAKKIQAVSTRFYEDIEERCQYYLKNAVTYFTSKWKPYIEAGLTDAESSKTLALTSKVNQLKNALEEAEKELLTVKTKAAIRLWSRDEDNKSWPDRVKASIIEELKKSGFDDRPKGLFG